MDFTLDIAKVALLIIILGLLGLNVFSYLARGSDLLGIVIKDAAGTTIDATKDTVKTSETGTKKATDVVGGAVVGTLGAIEKALDIKVKDSNPSYQPSDGTQGKKGFCLIGTDRNYRSCIYVGENDTCMSGKVFPSKDLCINPSLRQ